MLKPTVMLAFAAGVLLTSYAFAGRYGEDEIRHWRAVETVKNARAAKARAELQNAHGAKGQRGEKNVYRSSRAPFKYSH